MLMKRAPIIAPSLLAGDHAMLADSAAQIADAGLEWAHLDIMDGHFVPNLTFGPRMLACLKNHHPKLFYDVHLMLDNPDKFSREFINAGANLVSFHIEANLDHAAHLEDIRAHGAKSGIVINPETPIEKLRPALPHCDLVLVMTVHPGYGGQPFQREMLSKIETLAKWRETDGCEFLIEVDGGIDSATGPLCLKSGADVLVTGTSFFGAENKKSFARQFRLG